MIKKYVNEDAFGAKEEMLLVPVPAWETGPMEGFAGQVMTRFPLAESRLQTRGGLDIGRTMLIGTMAGDARWHPLFTLVLAAIHIRQMEGWEEAPHHLGTALSGLEERFGDKSRLATAGIPGSGFSGLRGGAPIEGIREVLDASLLPVFVYQDGFAGDRAAVLHADPQLSDEIAVA